MILRRRLAGELKQQARENEAIKLPKITIFRIKGKNKEEGEGYWLTSLLSMGPVLIAGSLVIWFLIAQNNKVKAEYLATTPTLSMSIVSTSHATQLLTPTAKIASPTPDPTATSTKIPTSTPQIASPTAQLATSTQTLLEGQFEPEAVTDQKLLEAFVFEKNVLIENSFVIDGIGYARYSFYNPDLGGTNCDGECEIMASGEKVADWWDRGIACPPEMPFFTRIYFLGEIYICVDRGGAIQYLEDGTFWLDFLTKEQKYPFWSVIYVYIDYP